MAMAAPLVTKNDFRKKVWDHLEKNDLAEFPRPVHNRIPNFKGGAAAAHSLSTLEEFQQAKVVKVNPDKAQETVRFLALEAEKTVLVPTPRLRHGLFNRLTPPGVAKADLRRVARAEGISKFSTPVGLENIVPVDLIVVGSVAVSKDGYRIGKGEGYADLEYAMARGAGAVTEDTIIITTVHDDQVFATLPSELFGTHDITVDVIVTPTQVIRVSQRHPKPTGIIWKLVTPRKLKAIPVLKALRDKEAEVGKDVTLGEPTEMELDEIAARKGRRLRADGEPGRPGAPRRRRPEMGAGDAEPSGHSDMDDEGADKRRRRRPVAPRRRRHVVSDAGASDAQEEPEIDTRHRQQRRRRRPLPPPPPQHEPVKRAEEEQRRPRARRERPPIDHSDGLTVIVRRIPSDARPRDLREAIGAADSPATIFSWKGRQGMALLRLRSAEAVKHLLEAAEGFKLVNEEVQLERYEQKARPAPQTDRPARSEKPERPERAEKAGRGERAERADRGEKGEPVKRERRQKREDRSRSGGRRRQGLRAISQEEAELTVFIGRLPASTRVRELRAALVAAGAQEPSIAWKGWRGMAFVRMKTAEAAEALVAAADQLKSISDDLVVERYKGREHYESDGGLKDVEKAPCKKTPKDKAREKTASANSGDEERVPPADVNADDVKEVVNGTDTPASDSPNSAAEPAAEPAKPASAPASDAPTVAAEATTKPPADVKSAPAEEAKSTPVKTEPASVKAEPVPPKTEPAAPSKAEPVPAEAKSTPVKAEPTPAKAESVPSKAEPAKADTPPAKTPEPVPAKSESANASPVPAEAAKVEPAAVEKKTEERAKKPEEPAPAVKAEVPAKTEEPVPAKKAEEPAPAKKAEEPAPAKKAEETTPSKTEASPTKDSQTAIKAEPNADAADSKPASLASDPAAPAAVKTEPSETAATPATDSSAADKPASPAPAPETTDAAEKASGDAA